MLIKCTLQCKTCRAVQKPYKQQPVAQVEEKLKEGPVCKDGASVTEPPSDDPISSQRKIHVFWFPLHVNQEGLPFDAFHSANIYVKALTSDFTVHDTENLTFSAEFRGCSARNDADFPHGRRGNSARAPRIFRAGGRGSSVRAGADLPCRRARIFRADSV